jgi:DNA polymerase I-like protein with 3'-5' exonuclease and polymerase domains
LQFNLFPRETKWTPPQDFPELTGEVALDLEGKDDGLRDGLGPGWPWRGGYVTGVSLAWGEPGREEARYYPVRQDGGGNLPVNAVMGWLKEQVAKPDVHLTLANAPYDLGWLRTEGLVIDRPVDDVQVMVPLLDEHRFSYGLDAIGKDFLGEQKDEALLIQACKDFGLIPKNATTKAAKNNMWRLPAKYIGPYAEQDARLTLRLKRHLLPLLEADDVLNAYGVERELQLLLVDMRARGIRVDLPHVERSIRRCDEQELVLLQELKRLTGRRLGAWDEGLGEALAQAGLPVPRTAPTRHKPQGSYSVTKEFLEEHKSHQLCQVIRNARRYDKGRSFLRSVQEHAFNGRLHAQFHPLKSDDGGAVTGRFSSTDPNLQQQPSPEKDPELGAMIRACYLPEEGEVWDAVDYSAQEPRLTVHYAYVAQKGGLPGAADAVAAYRGNPRTDYHQLVADMCGIARKPAKTINLGLAYGMGGAKLCHKLGLPTRWVVRNPNDGGARPCRSTASWAGSTWPAAGSAGRRRGLKARPCWTSTTRRSPSSASSR